MADAASTIFALSSGHGRAGVAVIRISGPHAGAALEALAGPRPKPRYAALRKLHAPGSSQVLDEALVLYFPAPRSETGEEMAELHVHGGRAVIEATLAALATVPGCRMAEPGEFARRAFENGKLDLTALEGLADLIDAETEAQRAQAVAQAGGALASLYEGWRERLIHAQALVEAGIDFSDEGDISTRTMIEARSEVGLLHRTIAVHLASAHRGEIIRGGFRVVLAGPPNAGKSSLLNALTRRDAAIVSSEAGTTRDVIDVHLNLGGVPVIVSDTAGIREATGAIEQEGIRRTLATAQGAHLVLWLTEIGAPLAKSPQLTSAQERGPVVVIVRTKSDLAVARPDVTRNHPPAEFAVSALTGEGLDRLTEGLADRARAAIGRHDAPPPTQQRHREHLRHALAHLEAFMSSDGSEPELRAEDLRQAANALSRITGRIDAEAVLGAIFGRFCIGK